MYLSLPLSLLIYIIQTDGISSAEAEADNQEYDILPSLAIWGGGGGGRKLSLCITAGLREIDG